MNVRIRGSPVHMFYFPERGISIKKSHYCVPRSEDKKTHTLKLLHHLLNMASYRDSKYVYIFIYITAKVLRIVYFSISVFVRWHHFPSKVEIV